MKFSQFKLLVDMMFTPDEQGGIKTRYDGTNVRQMNPLVLAYVGDAFFHLFVRTRLLSYEQARVHALHAFSAQIVSAWPVRRTKAHGRPARVPSPWIEKMKPPPSPQYFAPSTRVRT